MGWLRQAWQRAGCCSANEVAELLLAHDHLPSSLLIKPASLANNLRALDRGMRLGWWRRHRSLLGPLASVLERTPDELEQLLADPAPEAGARDGALGRIPLAVLGGLRPLDPRDELPPGFPELVGRPGRWRRAWWTTLDRRARTIAGQWLARPGSQPPEPPSSVPRSRTPARGPTWSPGSSCARSSACSTGRSTGSRGRAGQLGMNSPLSYERSTPRRASPAPATYSTSWPSGPRSRSGRGLPLAIAARGRVSGSPRRSRRSTSPRRHR